MYRFNLGELFNNFVDTSGLNEIIGWVEFIKPGIGDKFNTLINGMGAKDFGSTSLGYGTIVLKGDTNLTIGDSNYGLRAGKNGEIQAEGDVNIKYKGTSGTDSYGIAVGNSNLIYGSNQIQANITVNKETISEILNEWGLGGMGLEGTIESLFKNSLPLSGILDKSENVHGSSVMLGTKEDAINIFIDMGESTDNHAFYAEGIDDTKDHNQNSIVGNLNHLDVVGDVEAENGGLIDLHVGAEQNYLYGDIKAYGTAVASENGESAQSAKSEIAKNATVNLVVDHALAGQGTLAAANGGIVNLKLGANSNWTGRADDYGAASSKESAHTTFVDPEFENITSGGAVNLTMGNDAVWNVDGQSWITSVTTNGNAVIDLTGAGQERNEGADALTIYNMAGNATFLMHLDGDRTGSDMLYMKSADGSYTIYLDEAVDESDIKGSHNELDFGNLRFATVGNRSNADFSVKYVGGGIYDINYQVGTEGYDSKKDKENDVYNGTELGEVKPGTGMVEDFFTQTGTPPEAETGGASGASVLAAEEEPEDPDDIGATNYYISGAEKTVNDTGKTIIAMSKVNYSNAVYMDRLNKRMGEARYIDGDDGLWVRMRHDRIGKEDAFRSMNTMFELGYDWHAKGQKDGEHRQGVAFDYMRGTADYKNVAGDGDVRRAGVRLYDTWLGDKGHYSDYVVKYGRLSNDFDIYGELGNKIDGDYDNDVWSVSAEYGRKKDIGNDWYFEPQVQAQYAYVTSADYTTSQDTKVHLDSIDSLIGRAGFRLGRDTDEANTVYFKADILHEFLGGQSIRAMDSTGTLSTTYENEGTWYDVGFGFSHRMSKDKYMFLDVEKLFGNDNEDTYQVNIGLNMAF